MSKTETELNKIRGEIARLGEQRGEVAEAPIPRSEAEALIAAVVETLAEDPGLDPAPLGLRNGTFNGDELQKMLERPIVLLALFPDAIKAYLIAQYEKAIGKTKPGLPAAERRKRLAEIDAKIFELEVEEERLVEQLLADGVDVTRRPEADARAVLGLVDGPARPREATA